MGSTLGELQIDAIEGDVLTGYFSSNYDENVGEASRAFGAGVLEEAWEALGEPADSTIGALNKKISLKPLKARIEEMIAEVTFSTPNSASTFFTIRASDSAVFEGLEPVWWESGFFG